jgi:hypothetical protein
MTTIRRVEAFTSSDIRNLLLLVLTGGAGASDPHRLGLFLACCGRAGKDFLAAC